MQTMRAAAAFAAAILVLVLPGQRSEGAQERQVVGNFEIVLDRDRFTDALETSARTISGDGRMVIRCGVSGLEFVLAGELAWREKHETGSRLNIVLRVDRGEVFSFPATVRDDGALRVALLPSVYAAMQRGAEIAFRLPGGDMVFGLRGAAGALHPVARSCRLQ